MKLEFGPPPAIFPLDPFDVGDRDVVALGERGVCFLLSDTLVDVTGPEAMQCNRLLQQVTGADGQQRAASFEVTFNPRYERLIVHTVRVWRAGEAREASSPEAFELFRRELNLERAMYDGRVTAHMIVPDVRVGDIVETAFSTIGSNPALGGRLSALFTFQWGEATIETRCRIRALEDRVIDRRAYGGAPEPDVRTADGVREMTWRRVDAPLFMGEGAVPAWHIGYEAVRVADRMTWAQVADLFRPAYAPTPALPDDLVEEIDAIGRAHAEPSERAAEGLRFVQGALRYHSIGIGEGGYRPRPLEVIWATRYGDCKDASRLLCAVLDRLGVEACPALVNTWTGPGLDRILPSPTVFDHCIVRARIDGRSWWLDPTMPRQSGRLERLTPPSFGWALPLVEAATLDAMPTSEPILLADAQSRWTFEREIAAPARLEITTDYRGWRADDLRRQRENGGLRAIERNMRQSLEGQYGELTDLTPMGWVDDPADNRVTITEAYSVARPFLPAGDAALRFETIDDVVGPNLSVRETPRRQAPIDMGAPGRWRGRTTLTFPVEVQVAPWSATEKGPGVWGHSGFAWTGPREGVLTVDLEIRERVIEPVDAPALFTFVRRMRGSNGLSLVLPTEGGKLKPAGVGRTGWKSWAGVVAILVLLAFLRWAVAG